MIVLEFPLMTWRVNCIFSQVSKYIYPHWNGHYW